MISVPILVVPKKKNTYVFEMVIQGVLDYRDDWVQKKFPDNRNPDNLGTNYYIPIIEELLL